VTPGSAQGWHRLWGLGSGCRAPVSPARCDYSGARGLEPPALPTARPRLPEPCALTRF